MAWIHKALGDSPKLPHCLAAWTETTVHSKPRSGITPDTPQTEKHCLTGNTLTRWPEHEPGSLWDEWAPCTEEPGSESLRNCAPFTWLPGALSSPGNGGTGRRVRSPFPHSGPKPCLAVPGQILHRVRALAPALKRTHAAVRIRPSSSLLPLLSRFPNRVWPHKPGSRRTCQWLPLWERDQQLFPPGATRGPLWTSAQVTVRSS